jgi:hypothetical protein
MSRLTRRMWKNITITGVVILTAVLLHTILDIAFFPVQMITGWFLLTICLLLAFYNVRKKLSFVPFIGRSSTWLQLHIYLGIFSLCIFLLHIRWGLPDNSLEWILFTLFTAVSGSGLLGLYISRNFPKKLAARGEEIIYERIPILRKNIRDNAQSLALQSVEESGYRTIADFYIANLEPFFAQPRYGFHHLLGSFGPRKFLQDKIATLNLYLSEKEQKISNQMWEYVAKKYDLDYHYFMQKTLKVWLFVHIPLTYSLIMFGFAHGFFSHIFYGR